MSSLRPFRGFTGFHDCRHNFKCLWADYIFQWMSQIEYRIFVILLFFNNFLKSTPMPRVSWTAHRSNYSRLNFNQWCLKQNPHPMFLWLLLAMRHTFPTICPLNILWAALLLQSHQFLHRKMEREREKENEREITIIQVFYNSSQWESVFGTIALLLLFPLTITLQNHLNVLSSLVFTGLFFLRAAAEDASWSEDVGN